MPKAAADDDDDDEKRINGFENARMRSREEFHSN